VSTGKLCPEGWHVPAAEELEEMATFVSVDNGYANSGYGGQWDFIGNYLKPRLGWNEGDKGTDDYGFSALPAGFRHADGSFESYGWIGHWWCNTEINASQASFWWLASGINVLVLQNYWSKNAGHSVRCIKD